MEVEPSCPAETVTAHKQLDSDFTSFGSSTPQFHTCDKGLSWKRILSSLDIYQITKCTREKASFLPNEQSKFMNNNACKTPSPPRQCRHDSRGKKRSPLQIGPPPNPTGTTIELYIDWSLFDSYRLPNAMSARRSQHPQCTCSFFAPTIVLLVNQRTRPEVVT